MISHFCSLSRAVFELLLHVIGDCIRSFDIHVPAEVSKSSLRHLEKVETNPGVRSEKTDVPSRRLSCQQHCWGFRTRRKSWISPIFVDCKGFLRRTAITDIHSSRPEFHNRRPVLIPPPPLDWAVQDTGWHHEEIESWTENSKVTTECRRHSPLKGPFMHQCPVIDPLCSISFSAGCVYSRNCLL